MSPIKHLVFAIVGTLALAGCQTGEKRIYHSPNSEAGRAIAQLDADEQQYKQSIERCLKAIAAYRDEHEGKKGILQFSRIDPPSKSEAPRVKIHVIEVIAREDGRMSYRVRITYEDDALKVVGAVEVIERVGA